MLLIRFRTCGTVDIEEVVMIRRVCEFDVRSNKKDKISIEIKWKDSKLNGKCIGYILVVLTKPIDSKRECPSLKDIGHEKSSEKAIDTRAEQFPPIGNESFEKTDDYHKKVSHLANLTRPYKIEHTQLIKRLFAYSLNDQKRCELFYNTLPPMRGA